MGDNQKDVLDLPNVIYLSANDGYEPCPRPFGNVTALSINWFWQVMEDMNYYALTWNLLWRLSLGAQYSEVKFRISNTVLLCMWVSSHSMRTSIKYVLYALVG